MSKQIRKLLPQQRGVAMLMVLAFLALSVPMVTGALALSVSLSKDSEVKVRVLKDQYAAHGCTQYAYYLVTSDPVYVDGLILGQPDIMDFEGCTITITKVSEDEPLEIDVGDIVLALDNSGSVDDDELDLLKEAANTIVDHFDLNDLGQDLRIGVSRFRGSYDSVVGMTDIDIHGDDGFIYVDDAFRGTSEPEYADGDWDSSAGLSGGGLQIYLGGVDDDDINDMSGGWRTTFGLASEEEVVLSFNYNMTQDAEYESDEYSEVLVTVDAMQPGTGVNDYVARIYGDGSGGSNLTTGWQTFQVNLGTLDAGVHVLTIGGYNNQKTTSEEETEVLIDDVSVTVVCTDCPTFLEADYDADQETASYLDDPFRGTSEPAYADGTWDAAAGLTAGGLQVDLGGIDDDDVYGMSGGWQTTFNLAAEEMVALSFNYNLVQAANYESDEYSEVIVTVDAMQPGTGSDDYVARIYGDGNGGSDLTTGWESFYVDLGTLDAGAHTITIGGHNNKKTVTDETTTVQIDDLAVTATCDEYCDPVLDATFEGVTPLHDGIDGLVQGAPDLDSGTNIVAGIQGGVAQFSTGMGERVDVPNLMVVITDGNDTDGNSISDIETASENSGAEIFAVGVGSDISMDTLNAIASEEDSDHVFTTSEYSGLLSIIDTIVAAVDEALGTGILITIESVSPDGTISQYEVLLPGS